MPYRSQARDAHLGHKPEDHGFDRFCQQAAGQDAAAEPLRDRRWLEYGGLPVGSQRERRQRRDIRIWRDRRRRKQINFKLDHNFNASHKAAATYTYERSEGGANLMTWPDTFRGAVTGSRRHLSVTFTSTLSPTLVNEARVGMRRQGTEVERANRPRIRRGSAGILPQLQRLSRFRGSDLAGELPDESAARRSEHRPLLGPHGRCGSTVTRSVGRRANTFIKFGGEIRRGDSWGLDAASAPPPYRASPGATRAFPDIGSGNQQHQHPRACRHEHYGKQQRMRNLLSFLAGSVSSITRPTGCRTPRNWTPSTTT